jgi:flagellin-like protein
MYFGILASPYQACPFLGIDKMSSGYLKKIDHNRRKKAGISPVVATVILVAVAVVIAAALAGFAGSLFGSYSNGPQVKIQSMTLLDDGTGTITMSNAGSSDDAVTKVAVKGTGEVVLASPADDTNTIPKNSNPTTIDFDSVGAGLSSGQQVTAIISMQSGATITQTVTVEAAP